MLEALLKPLTVDRFFANYWPERCYASHGKPERLPAVFRSAALRDFETLARNYRGRVLFTRGRSSPYMVPAGQASPETLFRMGLTVYLDNIAPALPDSGHLLDTLEQEFGIAPGSARIGAFASPVADGVAPHYDVEDVISIQLQGEKRFYIAPVDEVRYPTGMQYSPGDEPLDEQYPQISGRFPHWEHAQFECIVMKPGSVLFMPRGTWHKTEADAASLAVSIILKPAAAADTVLEQLRWLLLQQPRWRKPLYGAWGNGRRRTRALQEAGELIARLPGLLQRLDAAALETALSSELQRVLAIKPDSRLRRLPNARVEVLQQAQHAEVRILVHSDETGETVSAQMQVHPQVAALFQWLGEQDTVFTLRDMQQQLPALPDDQHVEVAQACVKARLLRLLWYPELPEDR